MTAACPTCGSDDPEIERLVPHPGRYLGISCPDPFHSPDPKAQQRWGGASVDVGPRAEGSRSDAPEEPTPAVPDEGSRIVGTASSDPLGGAERINPNDPCPDCELPREVWDEVQRHRAQMCRHRWHLMAKPTQADIEAADRMLRESAPAPDNNREEGAG